MSDSEAMELDNLIHVCYGKERLSFNAEDVTPEFIQAAFQLEQRPQIFHTDVGGNVVAVPVEPDRVKPGHLYQLPTQTSAAIPKSNSITTSISKMFNRNVWENDGLSYKVQNAVVCSRASYASHDSECELFLSDHISNHGFSKITRSQHGDCHFVMASEQDQKLLYIGFRGTKTSEDWLDNCNTRPVEGSDATKLSFVQGKFHSGFLRRALLFPINKILSDEEYKDFEIIVCGHSLGGAIASIVAMIMMLEVKKRVDAGYGTQKNISCITFGSPLVGDEMLKMFCDEKDISKNFFHFVHEWDPIPRLLSYAQFLSNMTVQMDNNLRTVVQKYTSSEGTSFYENKLHTLMSEKDKYVDMASKLFPVVEMVLDAAAICVTGHSKTITIAKVGSTLISEVLQSARQNNRPNSPAKSKGFVPIGNFLFISESGQSDNLLKHNEEEKIMKSFELALDKLIEDASSEEPICHMVENYEKFVKRWGRHAGTFSPWTSVMTRGYEDYVPREIELEPRYLPEILSAELVKEESKEVLRLRITGHNLFNFVLEECQFNFGFPFGRRQKNLTMKNYDVGTQMERLIFEENFVEAPSIGDHGTLIVLTTVFGQCKYMMSRSQIRNLRISSVNQISRHESISIVIKRAIQRGMAIAQMRRSMDSNCNWKPMNEKIIQDVSELAELTLDSGYYKQLQILFKDISKNIQFILSSEEEYQKVQACCDKIEDFLKKPLNIIMEKSIARKICIGMATLLGGVTMAYVGGPGLVIVGAVEAVSLSLASVAGAVGSVSAGLCTNKILSQTLVDDNYEQVVSFVTTELFNRLQNENNNEEKKEDNENSENKKRRENLIQEVSDLREDGDMFNLEKALLKLFDPELGVKNFDGCDLEKCTEASKLSVLKRINCTKIIHDIRTVLGTQCYIGIVGVQDAGKTTFVNSVWNLNSATGYLTHTDFPNFHEIHKNLIVVDYPGSTGLDYHAETFSICGAMNNLIIIMVPFTGDVNKMVSDEISKMFRVMAGSESCEVLLCITKCGNEMPKIFDMELKSESNPVDILKDRFATKLNLYFEENRLNFEIDKNRIFFTDWKMSGAIKNDLIRKGISDVNGIRNEIKKYLLSHNIFQEDTFPHDIGL